MLGTSLNEVNLLGSNSASVTDLKRIETPHSLYCDFRGYKTFTTRWSGCRVQVWVPVWAPAGHLAISPKAVLEGNQRFRWQNQRPSYWGRSPALFGLSDRQAQTQGISKSAAVAALSNLLTWAKHATTLAILTQFKSQQGLNACKFWVATSHFLFHVKWKFRWNWQEAVDDQSSSHCFAQSFYHLLVSR